MIFISGFADEISDDFEEQLKTVRDLGMQYISLRSAYGKNIADYSTAEVEEKLLPLLRKYEIRVSSIGSPVGKLGIDDEEGFGRQKQQLETLCRTARLLDCRYIRVFSFYVEAGKQKQQREKVLEKMRAFVEIAAAHDRVLIHENEKDIYGDNLERNLDLMQTLGSEHFAMAFDFANFVQVGEDPWICWQQLKDYVAYIHIKDAVSQSRQNVVFGTGEGRGREILQSAVHDEGYSGFLTLEPHLVQFKTLQSLEKEEASEIIKENLAESGAAAYAMQYKALREMLEELDICCGQR